MIKILTSIALATAATAALAHPGHADQSIHLAEWLMGAGVLAATVFAARHFLRKARQKH